MNYPESLQNSHFEKQFLCFKLPMNKDGYLNIVLINWISALLVSGLAGDK